MPKAWYENTMIDQPGHYMFALEKTTITRLPAPYSKPSCVQQNSSQALKKNIMHGQYTVGSCKKSCNIKAELELCATMGTIERHYVRSEYTRRYFKDQPIAESQKCVAEKRSQIAKHVMKCVETCHNPCYEQYFKSRNTFLRRGKKSDVMLSFYFEDAKEAHIEEVPRYEVVTLVSNFGGQLGLMVGMSALSILEVLVWLVLLLIDCVHGLFAKFL